MAKRPLELYKQEEAVEEEEEEEEESQEEDDENDVDYAYDGEVEEVGEERRKGVVVRVVSNGQRNGVANVNASVRSGNTLSCQADDCGVDLRVAKKYHRRHKVCEWHAKAAVVLVGGIRQRFCQQCSRFHEVSQFDDTKRSCRKRLAGHNKRRRKNNPDLQPEGWTETTKR